MLEYLDVASLLVVIKLDYCRTYLELMIVADYNTYVYIYNNIE